MSDRQKQKTQNNLSILARIGRPFYLVSIFLLYLIVDILSFLKKSFKKKPKFFIKLNFKLTIFLLFFFSFSYLVYTYVIKDLPSPNKLITFNPDQSTQILDRNGRLLYKIYKNENRTYIKIDQLPDNLKKAIIAIEDSHFYQHKGFSIGGIVRAYMHNLTNDDTQGGSTITQQLVKNVLLDNEQTFQRKIKEVIVAIEIESIFTKDQILEMYLNEVSFGGPAYGVQEASQQYFGVDVKKINLAQAAFLAGLPKAPSKYSPYYNPELAFDRQKQVLDQMLANNYITVEDYQNALSLKLSILPPKKDIKAPHFVMYIKDLLSDYFGEDFLYKEGLVVTTSLDLDIQQNVENYLDQELNKIKSYRVKNGAVLVTRPKTGEILAMVGSNDFFDIKNDGQVNLTTALRQPGSSIKPLNYALAFENELTTTTIINDQPISFNLPGQKPWAPKNYDGKFHGPVTPRTALANSYNIPSVLLLSQNGPSQFAALAKKMGISTWNDPSRYGLSMALGSLEVKMTDLATAYSTFANNGLTVPLNPILKIESKSKSVDVDPCKLNQNPCHPIQTISPTTSFIIADILSDNQARSQAFGINSVLNIKTNKTAVKTGTSNDLRDNWTIGFTPDFLVATWVGNNDNTPMSKVASGITGASPIWANVINDLLTHNPNNNSFTIPDTLKKISICSATGTLPCGNCQTRTEYVQIDAKIKSDCSQPNTQPKDNILTGVSQVQN